MTDFPTVPEEATFAEMGLLPEVARALEEMGFLAPMPVQRETFPRLMAGRDLLVQSRTGSGKTAAFAIPFTQGLVDPAHREVQALILCPTRELALQVANECGKIAQYRSLAVVPIYGGAPMGKQVEGLKAGAQIVAGTPGRVIDHLRRGTLRLDRLRILVLDEADEMLSMGFYEEISEILKNCPTDRQTLLFSATIPEEIERISRRYMREPEKIVLSAGSISAHEIQHAYYMVSGMGRTRDLVRVLDLEKPESAIIFCNTREEVGYVAEQLRKAGLDAEAISSDLGQRDRERVMGRMKAGNLHYLVATDIAARGIDITDLSHVFNYTFPESPAIYVHRTGRTGRAGKSGTAISLISPRELGNFYYLKLTYKIRPEERPLPMEQPSLTSPAAPITLAIELPAPLISDDEKLSELLRRLTTPAHGEVAEEWRALARRLIGRPDAEARIAQLLSEHFVAGSTRPNAITTASAEGNGHPRKRSRRRRDRPTQPGRKESPRISTAPIEPTDGREFWETWVDDRKPTTSEPNATRLFLSLGRRDGVTETDVEQLLARHGIVGQALELHTSHSYFAVAAEGVDPTIAALHGVEYAGRPLTCQKARR